MTPALMSSLLALLPGCDAIHAQAEAGLPSWLRTEHEQIYSYVHEESWKVMAARHPDSAYSHELDVLAFMAEIHTRIETFRVLGVCDAPP